MEADPQLLVAVYFIVPVPAARPVTFPAASTVVLVGVVVLQTPAPTEPASVSDMDAPEHTLPGPEIVPAFGAALTVTVTEAKPRVGVV